MSDDLGALQVSFEVNLSGLTSGIASAKEQINSVGPAAQQAGDAAGGGFFGAIGSVVSFASQVGMAVLGLQTLASTAINTVGSLLAPAASAEQTGVAFDTLMHSTSAAKEELSQLNDFAARTPFQTDAIDNAAEKLIAFGFQTKSVIPYITAIGDSLSALGKGTDANLSSVIDIFGKIQAQGKLTAVDMMQLSTYGIPAWKLLSEAMGKPVSVLQEMEKQGKLTSDVVLPALSKGMEDTFGGGMAKQATTMNGQLSTFVSNLKLGWEAFLGVQGGQVVKGSLFYDVEQGLNGIGTLLASGSFQKGLASVGKDVGDTLTQLGGLFKGLNLGGGVNVSGIFGNIHEFFITVQKDLSTVNPADVKAAFADLFSILSGGASIVQTVTGDLSHFASGLLSAANNSGVVQDVMGALRDILPHVSAFLQYVGNDLEQNVLPPLESLISNVGSAVGRFAQWLDTSGAAKNTLSNLADTIGTVASVAGTLVGWLADLVGWLTSGGPQTYILATAVGVLGAAFIGLKIADTVSGFASIFAKLNEGEGIVANLASSFKDKLGASIDNLISKQFPNLKADLDGLKTSTDETATSVENLGTEAETTQEEVAAVAETGPTQLSLWDDMETSVEGVGTTAETTATEVESIGAASTTAEGEVAASSAGMDTEIAAVGETADATAASTEAVGTAATTAGSSIVAAMGPAALAIAAVAINLNHFQEDASNPSWASSVGENIKNGLLDGLAPFSGLGNIKAMWDDFTSHVEGKTLDMETVLQGVKGVMGDMGNHVAKDTVQMKNVVVDQTNDMSQDVRGAFANMADNSLTSAQTLSQKAQDLFKQFVGNAIGDLQSLDQSTIQYMNDVAAYIEQKSAEAADQANANFMRIHHMGTGFSSDFTSNSPFPGHASGITNSPTSHIAVVGENGPELMYVPQGASIYPSGSYPTPAMYSAMSGGSAPEIHIHNHLYIDSMEMADMVGQRILKMASHSGPVRRAA